MKPRHIDQYPTRGTNPPDRVRDSKSPLLPGIGPNKHGNDTCESADTRNPTVSNEGDHSR